MSQNSKLTNSLLSLASFIIIIAGMRASHAIVVPFLLSVFIAVISAPLLFFLVNRKVPTWLALSLIISLILVVVSLMGVLVGSSVNDFSRNIPEYESKLEAMGKTHIAWIRSKGLQMPNQEKVFEQFDPGAALQLASSTLKELSGVLGNAFLILLTVIFMLLEASGLPQKTQRAFGENATPLKNMQQFASSIKSYVAIKTNMSLLTGFCVYLILIILDIDYALLWGVLTFFLNYVPNIGSIIAAIPPIILALVQHGVTSAITTTIAMVVINVIIGSAIEPRFMGRELGLSTLVVFLSLVFWGWVLGPVGMILSVPLTMAVKIGLEGNQSTKWLAVMLGSD